MTDETEPTAATNRATDDGDTDDGDTGDGDTVERLTSVLNYAVLGGLLLLALVSGVQLYLSVSRTVTTFVVPEYRAPVLAAFNLVVLLVAALGISVQLRRLSSSTDGTDAADADT